MSGRNKIEPGQTRGGMPALRGLNALGAERLVGIGFRCWLAGYETGDIACWERGWNAYSVALGPSHAKRAVTELACWVRALRASASRKIEYSPVGCPGFCADECMAIALIAASQHHRCPAMRACALALTGSELVDPVIDAANAFADALQDAEQRLSPDRRGGATRRRQGPSRLADLSGGWRRNPPSPSGCSGASPGFGRAAISVGRSVLSSFR